MKKLLVLGSDYSTAEVVKEAHNMGLYVIVSDLMNNSPTKKLADESWKISTTDVDLLTQKCKEENISAIMFGASDFNINNAREICRRLNLPIYCADDYSWKVARDKFEFKKICKEVGAPIAQDYHLTDELKKEDIEKISFPVVIKPSDKSGNRGMSYCMSSNELSDCYKYARSISNENIIVERMLKGKEYNVHYVLANGEARLLYFNSTHHQPGEKSNLYSLKITTTCHLKKYIEEVNESAKKIIQKAGCKEGIVWFDCILDEDDNFYFLEMGYRFGGVMTYVPYSRVIGFNVIKWMLEISIGVKHQAKHLPKELNTAIEGCAVSYHLFSKYDGEISEIKGLEELEKKENIYLDLPKRKGDLIRKDTNSGLIGVYGKNIEDVCETLKYINSNFKIYDSKSNNMFIIFDDYESLREEYYIGLREFD
ncbi:MAG: ATP-grasp domain-containing protein [Clostridia bacterium]|nr:ATP-grasp domain-containing protein [Clostridia bacterium]